MHRIDGPGATADNKFTEGDPVSGVQATVVTDDWLNTLQEELIAVITDPSINPPIALNKSANNQLIAAIKKLVSAATAGDATTTNKGIARFGTPAEQLAGALSSVISNPAGVLALLTAWFPKRSFAANDYIRIPDLPGGLIIQWGRATSTAVGNATANLVINFPNSFLLGLPIDFGFNTTAVTYGSWDAQLSTNSTIATRWQAAPSDYAYIAIGT